MGKGRQREATERWKAATAANCGFESFALLLNYSSPLLGLACIGDKGTHEAEKRCTGAGTIICQANGHMVGQQQQSRLITIEILIHKMNKTRVNFISQLARTIKEINRSRNKNLRNL